ncbi:MAG: DUF86 domain-containing protein [Desulfuromonadaceae bacterium]
MSEREWRFYLDDMVRFCEKVVVYTELLDKEGFVDDEKTYDATLRILELLGEAATHIPEEIRSKYSIIPWRQVVATRNQLIHGYLGIDNDILWSIIQEDIPNLYRELKRLKV